MLSEYEILLSLCEGRRSCRKFSPEPVPERDIERILKVASTSPFASGRKSWEVLVVRDKCVFEALEQAVAANVERIAGQMDEDVSKLFKQYARNFSFFRQAPVLFIPVFKVVPTFKAMMRDHLTPDLQQWERDNIIKSISCVSMLVLLAAQSLGLGACYMTGPLLAQENLAAVLNLPPGRQLGAIIPLGKPLA